MDEKLPVAISDLCVGLSKRRYLRFDRLLVEAHVRIAGLQRLFPGQPRLPTDGRTDAGIEIGRAHQREIGLLRSKHPEDRALLVSETNGAEAKLLVVHQHRE